MPVNLVLWRLRIDCYIARPWIDTQGRGGRKGRRKRDQKEEGREEKNTQSRGTYDQTTYLERNLHLEYIKNSFKNT